MIAACFLDVDRLQEVHLDLGLQKLTLPHLPWRHVARNLFSRIPFQLNSKQSARCSYGSLDRRKEYKRHGSSRRKHKCNHQDADGIVAYSSIEGATPDLYVALSCYNKCENETSLKNDGVGPFLFADGTLQQGEESAHALEQHDFEAHTTFSIEGLVQSAQCQKHPLAIVLGEQIARFLLPSSGCFLDRQGKPFRILVCISNEAGHGLLEGDVVVLVHELREACVAAAPTST